MDGKQVREIRQSLKMDQEAFGELLGVKRNTVASWETGARNVPRSQSRTIEVIGAIKVDLYGMLCRLLRLSDDPVSEYADQARDLECEFEDFVSRLGGLLKEADLSRMETKRGYIELAKKTGWIPDDVDVNRNGSVQCGDNRTVHIGLLVEQALTKNTWSREQFHALIRGLVVEQGDE